MFDIHKQCKREIASRDKTLERLRKIVERVTAENNALATELADLKKSRSS